MDSVNLYSLNQSHYIYKLYIKIVLKIIIIHKIYIYIYLKLIIVIKIIFFLFYFFLIQSLFKLFITTIIYYGYLLNLPIYNALAAIICAEYFKHIVVLKLLYILSFIKYQNINQKLIYITEKIFFVIYIYMYVLTIYTYH